MNSKNFYNTDEYRKKQSKLTKRNWKKGTFNSLKKREKRTCSHDACKKTFIVTFSNPKKYCSRSCAAKVNNRKRRHSQKTKEKISDTLSGRQYPNRQGKTMRIAVCKNSSCKKEFSVEAWMSTIYCSNQCAITVIGGRPTSPKAARGKAGIRPDINSKSYFYSRWEANYARILDLQGINWIHQPKVFKLKKQTYTPDFYLPQKKEYIEIKNFLSDYSRKRDGEFRKLYSHLRLKLILKKDYLKLQEKYSSKIDTWEYS